MRKRTTLSNPIGASSTGELEIQRDDFTEVLNYARAAGNDEICGFLLVRRLSPDHYVVIPDTVHIPEQATNPGAAETLFQGEIAQRNLEDDYEDDENVFRLLWHSHVRGSASFSRTDTDTHQNMGNGTGFDAMFFMVVNQHGQATANLEVYTPFRIGTQIHLVVLENEEEVDLYTYRQLLKRKRVPLVFPPKDDEYTDKIPTPIIIGARTLDE